MKKPVLLILAVLIGSILLTACGTSKTVRAGAWHGSTEYGDFTFYISEDGKAIEDVDYSVNCGENWTDDSNFTMGEPRELDGNKLDFGLWIAGQVPVAIWEGEFSADGKTLSGTLSLFAGLCETDFEITR